MAITYPVDVENTLWATYQVSTGEIVARNRPWPVADGSEIIGQDPDFVMLLHVNDTPPQYDSRLFTLDSTEGIDADANTLHKTFETTARSIPERTIAAKNEEANQLNSHVDLVREAIRTRLMVGALLAYVTDAQTFPAKVDAMASSYKDLAVKLWANRDRLDEIIAAIENGEDPDLDAGWAQP